MNARNARATTAVRAMPGTLGTLAGREVGVASVIALVVGLALVLFGPPPGDLPAHLYRTELVENGVLVWDTYWYAGHYPLLAYSLLYYFPAALVGNDVVALVSVVAAAALFASLAEREWGDRARWPSRVFAVVACGPLFTGTYPYAAGLAVALGALKALQLGRTWVAVVLAVVTAGLSPLAFLYLCLACVAAFLAGGRRLDRRAVAMGAALFAVGLAAGSAAPRLPVRGRVPVLPPLGAAGGDRAVRRLRRPRPARRARPVPRLRLRAVGTRRGCGVPRALADRRERDPAPGHRAPARAARGGNRLVPAPLALRRRDHRRARLHTSALRRSGASTAATRAPRRPPSGRRRSPSWPSGPRRESGSRSSRPETTGRPTGSRAPASRSRAAGTGSSTSPRTRSSTRTPSTRPPTSAGCTTSVCASSCSPTRSSGAWARAGRPTSSAPVARASSRSPARAR